VLAVPTGIDQMLDKIIDNALAVPAEGSTIRVVITGGDHPMVSVLDQGPGMSDTELARASGAVITLVRRGPRGLTATITFDPA